MLFFLLIFSLFKPEASLAKKEIAFTVEITNIRQKTGQVRLSLFKPCAGFPTNCQPLASQATNATGESISVTFRIEPGDYAVAVYHDVNGNKQLDKKLFGIPKEPYGFSNNFRPRFSPPTFQDCKVGITGESKTQISLIQ